MRYPKFSSEGLQNQFSKTFELSFPINFSNLSFSFEKLVTYSSKLLYSGTYSSSMSKVNE